MVLRKWHKSTNVFLNVEQHASIYGGAEMLVGVSYASC